MRRVIYYVTTSLDGFIARPDGGIDWLQPDDGEDYGYPDFVSGVDTVILGRRTWDLLQTFGEYPYPDLQAFVFSRTLTQAEPATVVTDSVRDFVAGQRQRPGRNLWLIGGGQLAAAFFAADAVDEVMVFVQPVLLGQGRPLTDVLSRDVRLQFRSTRPFRSGVVGLHYDVLR